MLKLLKWLAACLALALSAASAAEPALDFAHYRAQEIHSGRAAKAVLVSTQDREFRSQLLAAAGRRPNFSGHYVATVFGCGASCVMAAFIDAKNGHVSWLPFTVCCGDYPRVQPLEFRRDSALLIVRGMRNEEGLGTYYYVFSAGGFRLLAARPK